MTPEPLERVGHGHRFRVWRWPGTGRPVVCLHGFTGDGQDWAPVVGAFGGRPVFAPDLLGHGQSDVAPDPAAHRLPDQALALAQALNLDDFDLWGYSFGGRVALSWACAGPTGVGHLGLIGATPGLADPADAAARRAADDALAGRLLGEPLPTWLAAWQATPIIATQRRIEPQARQAMQARRRAATAAGWAASLRGAGTGAMPSLWANLGALAMPVTLITGAEDEKFSGLAAQMHRLIPRARHRVLPGAGHCAHLEAPGAFSDALASLDDAGQTVGD
ncbi:MAG: alpha/beta fold hydrolase [Myxococcales bacterium]|nr:alpha/beta fold hydrolase [Myxococcales bacterium]